MPIAIIVEDGTNVLGANSYVDVATVRQFALNRGVVLSTDDDEVSAFLVKGFDYLETKECEYQGDRVFTETAFPRSGVTLNKIEIAVDVIPVLLKTAQCQLVIAQHNGIDPLPNFVASDYVIEDKVGPLTTKYADPVLVGMGPKMGAVDATLAPLFGQCASFSGLRTVRV